MRTLSIDSNSHDLDFTVVDRLESVRQRCTQRILFLHGEWFQNTSLGTMELEILGHHRNDLLSERIYHDALLSVDDVNEVTDIILSLDNKTRRYSVDATVHTDFGSFELPMELPNG